MRRFLFLLALSAASCASIEPPSRRLEAIASEHWQRQLENDIATRSELGLPIEHLPDVSFARASAGVAFAKRQLAALQKIDATRLSDDERVSLAILRYLHERTVENAPHFWLRFAVTPYASPIRPVQAALGRFAIKTAADAQNYLALVSDYARFADQLTALVREQQRRGILVPKREIPLVRTLLTSAPLAVDENRLEALAVPERDAFRAELRDRIDKLVDPALARLAAVFSPEYEAAAPAAIGIGHYPGGDAAYRALIRLHTSYDFEPRALHELGLRELQRIDAELAEVRAQMGFNGTAREFYPFLQQFWTDRGAFRDPQAHFTAYVRKIEPHLDRFFSTRPRAPYDTQRLAPGLEAAMTFGYYQPPTAADPAGHYYFNGSPSKPRSITFGAALMAHELVPGHHFQIARQIEAEQIPLWRRHRHDTVFIEGWGEYAAILAGEMDLYAAPEDRAGRLLMDSMLSTRLVVDTGLNALGWTAEQAAEFMRDHTPLTDAEIETEILRYAVDIPGQALAYKVGSLKIVELRRTTTMDVRAFHEWMLAAGSMPLSLKQPSAAPVSPASASR